LATTTPAKVLKLPFWSELERAIPNMIARSALFAPIARGRRKIHDRAEIAGRGDFKILYSGKQLDMADCDVFLQALAMAKKVPLGQAVAVNRAEFLRSIGRKDGKSDYRWFDDSMHRLKFNAVTFTGKRLLVEMSLIDYWGRCDNTGAFGFIVNPKMVALFANQGYSLIDWQKRLAIAKHVDLAKWMQNYIASHERGEHRISLAMLKDWSGYSSPLRKFREAMLGVLNELKRLEIIASPKIRAKNNMVIYVRL
jgi:hypothetical protein